MTQVIGDRVFLTFVMSFATMLFIWMVSFPIGVYSATHQYSWGDYGLTFIGFLGLATPNFLLALVLLYFAQRLVRHLDRRPDGSRLHRPADELGQVRLGARSTCGCR